MFELSKTILEKVSFDEKLFCKELTKAIKRVNPDEKLLLKVWCLYTFGRRYEWKIKETFKDASQIC